MANRDFNIGKDANLVIITEFGRLDLRVTEFQSRQNTHQARSMALQGYTSVADIPDTWTFSFQVDRDGSKLDAYIAQREQTYWASGALGTIDVFVQIRELDGSKTNWHYGRATLRVTSAGTFRADDTVRQTVEGEAAFREAA